MKQIRVLLAGCMVAASVWAADVTGEWTADTQGRGGNTTHLAFNLKADGDRLTGTVTGINGETDIQDGIIDDDTISFEVVREFHGNQVTQRFMGTMNDDSIRFSVTMEGAGHKGGGETRQFEAYRTSGSPRAFLRPCGSIIKHGL